MRKTDKKTDNKLRQALTEACDFALQNITGYQSISHSVNYNRFPESLVITCQFEDKTSAAQAKQQSELLDVINNKLDAMSVNLKNPHKQIRFEP